MPGSGVPGSNPENPPAGEDPKAEDPKPADPNPKDPKPADPKPKTPKPTPPKRTDPYSAVATSVELPAVDNVEPQELAKFTLYDESRPMFVKLIGGKSVTKGSEVFSIEPANTGTGISKTDWSLSIAEDDEGKDKVEVAQLKYDPKSKQLMFNWQPTAKEQNAGTLRNCALNLSYHTFQKQLALRKPIKLEPFVLELNKSGSQCRSISPTSMRRSSN